MFAGKPDPGTWLPVPAEKSYVFMARLEVKGIPLELLSDDRQGGFTPFGIGFHREGSYMDNIYAVEARDTVVSIDKKYPIIAERPISGKWD